MRMAESVIDDYFGTKISDPCRWPEAGASLRIAFEGGTASFNRDQREQGAVDQISIIQEIPAKDLLSDSRLRPAPEVSEQKGRFIFAKLTY
jgi:hypothetical protein